MRKKIVAIAATGYLTAGAACIVADKALQVADTGKPLRKVAREDNWKQYLFILMAAPIAVFFSASGAVFGKIGLISDLVDDILGKLEEIHYNLR